MGFMLKNLLLKSEEEIEEIQAQALEFRDSISSK